jgi:hypothetical protein
MPGMQPDPAGRLARWRQDHGDRLLTLLTALLLLLMFVTVPLQAAGLKIFHAAGLVLTLTIIGGVLVLSGSPAVVALMLLALGMNALVVVLRLRGAPSALDLYMVAGAWLILAGTLALVVARAVFGPGEVNYHRVVGAVLLYLLIAMVFASLYVVVGNAIPRAFTGIEVEESPALANTVIYFSFVTLTSTGYGDVVPLHPLSRSLCNLEAVIGQLYPATLLARLVTLELANRR